MGGPASQPSTCGDGPSADFLPRPLTAEEREAAWRAANFHSSSSGHERPVALWILGPSAVGKSTLTARVGHEFDIPVAAEEPSETNDEGRQRLDAVIVDGEFMREAHDVWQRWVKTPDWRSSYPALKSLINKEKDAMSTEAASRRKHLVIPQTLLNLEKGLTEVEELAWQGYTNHMLAVVAPLEDCQRRGRCREKSTGKRYEPREFELSIAAIPPMIANSNGRYQVIQALEPEGSADGLDFRVLARGLGGACKGAAFDAEELGVAIAAAIGSNTGSSPPSPTIPGATSSGSSPAWPASAAVGGWLGKDRRRPRRSSCPALMASLQPRPLTPEERHEAWEAANFYEASRQEKPIALWVLGPPCVGKSTLATKLAHRYDIEDTGGGRLDAVLIDGGIMREAHGVWRSWMQTPDWKSADQALKSIFNKEKDRLSTEATMQRKHLVIGRRLLDFQKGLTEIAELSYQGYTNHVVGLVAPLEECEGRARRREKASGKRYVPHEFHQALASIPAMANACNGRYELIRPAAIEGQDHGLSFKVVDSGVGGGHQAAGSVIDADAAEASAERLSAAIAAAAA